MQHWFIVTCCKMWWLHLWVHLGGCFFSQCLLKCMQTLEAKPIRQSCQFCSLKAEQLYFFMYLEYRSWRCFFFFLFTLKLLWYLLMSSAAYLTAGFACFRCNIWQPGGTDSFNGGVFFLPSQSRRCTCSHCALPNKEFHYNRALSGVWECLCCWWG